MDEALALTIQRLRAMHDLLSLLGTLLVRAHAAIAAWTPDGRLVLDNPRSRALPDSVHGASSDLPRV